MAKLSIYQGETLSIGVTSQTISLTDVELAIVIYKRCEESHQYLNVGSSLTISASDTAQFSCGEYAIEVKVVYQGRLFTSKACNVLEVMPARSKDIYNDEEDPTLSSDNAINVNIEQHDNYIEVKLMQGSGGGSGSTVVVTNSDSNTTAIKVDGVDKVTDLARAGYVTSALQPYAKSADVANTYATSSALQTTNNNVSNKADKAAVKGKTVVKTIDKHGTYKADVHLTKANFSGHNTYCYLGDTQEVNIYFYQDVANDFLDEIILIFSPLTDNMPLNFLKADGEAIFGYQLVGEIPTLQADHDYVMSIMDGMVVCAEWTYVEFDEEE